jgi:hypothetical protein
MQAHGIQKITCGRLEQSHHLKNLENYEEEEDED